MRSFICGIIVGIIVGTLALIHNARIWKDDDLFLLEYAGQVWEYEEAYYDR